MQSNHVELNNKLVVLLVLGLALLISGCPWDKDMVDQASVKPQESIAPKESEGVPIKGGETLPIPTTERELFAAKDAAASLPNPVPATPESLARGENFYQVHCFVCHGSHGKGDGPVGVKFDPSPVDLNLPHTQDQTDGQLFFTITRGRVTMPFYRDALNQQERWDLINYIRFEFGQTNHPPSQPNQEIVEQ